MKIAFFTYNLAHISNWVERLIPYMNRCEFAIFHIANMQKVEPKILHGVTYFDISSMTFKQIDKVVCEWKPSLFVNLNFRSLSELFFQRLCVHRQIRQIYLEHGYFSCNTLHFKTAKAKKHFFSTIYRQLNFLLKFGGLMCSNHCYKKELNIIYQVFFKGNFSASHYDHYFVYSQREYELLSKIFKTKKDELSIVGYPIFNDEKQKEIYNMSRADDNEVLYVHQPLISDGFASISYEEEKIYIQSIEKAILKKYGRLVVLLHPRSNLSEYVERFSDTSISIIQSPNNPSCFANKSLVLGHYSTALLYSLYFERPTAILEYPTAKNDSLFQGIFPMVTNLDDLATRNFKIDASKKAYMVGKYNTYEHIAQEILKQIN